MAFPPAGYTLGETAAEAEEARGAWAAVAHAVLDFEPVTMVVDPQDVEVAATYLSSEIEVVEAPLDDAWMRDIGPTFVHDEEGGLAGIDWVFNGWGQQDWARWDHDQDIARLVLEHAGVERVASDLVNEGGGVHVDGVGSVLVTRTVQLDPMRNPGLAEDDVAAELRRTLGADRVVWLPQGLTRDNDTFGTRGHVDIVATFPQPGVVLLHDQRDASHPDHEVTRTIREILRDEDWTVIDLPAPRTLEDGEGWVDYSYVNHLVVNGGVIACTFGDPNDQDAERILAEAYPGRRVVGVEARPFFARGGGIHCITQHQPSPRRTAGG
jgi:agmatine deiminase